MLLELVPNLRTSSLTHPSRCLSVVPCPLSVCVLCKLFVCVPCTLCVLFHARCVCCSMHVVSVLFHAGCVCCSMPVVCVLFHARCLSVFRPRCLCVFQARDAECWAGADGVHVEHQRRLPGARRLRHDPQPAPAHGPLPPQLRQLLRRHWAGEGGHTQGLRRHGQHAAEAAG